MKTQFAFILLLLMPGFQSQAQAGDVQLVHRDQLETSIKHVISELMPSYVKQFECEIRHIPETIEVPEGHVSIQTEPARRGKYKGFLLFQVEIFVNQQRIKKISPSVKVRTFEQAAILGHDVARGVVLTADAVQMGLIETTQLQQAVHHSLEVILTKRTKRYLRAGTVITDQMLEAIPVIHRGDAVTLIVQQANITVTTVGKALDDGGMHEIIDVKNTNSNRRLKGEVIDTKRVLIRPEL